MRPRRCQHFCAVAPVLPRQLRPAPSCRSAPLTPVEQGHQLCRGQRDPAGRGGRRPVELPLFEPLRQHAKANAVMPDQFDQSGTTATEGIQSSIEGVLCQALLHQHRQANGTFPHVRDPARQVDASTWQKCDHRPSSAPRTRRKARPSTSASTHTETPPALRGRGIASELVKGALEMIRADGLKVVAGCGFVVDYLSKHPEYADLEG